MSKRVNNKRGNRVARRFPNRKVPCKVRGGYRQSSGDWYLTLPMSGGFRYIP